MNNMASKRKLKELTKELRKRHIPQGAIWDLNSLGDNFAYSVLVNTKYKEQIEGFSIIELSQWLQKNNIRSDFDLLQLILGDNYNKEVSNGQ